jgi:hypothetical protein
MHSLFFFDQNNRLVRLERISLSCVAAVGRAGYSCVTHRIRGN